MTEFATSRWRPPPHPLPVAKGYQPEWVDGREVGTGLRECNSRYLAIKGYLETHGWQYPTPIDDPMTVLDLGAYNGYFCRRLAQDFGASCTAVDNTPRLKESPGVVVIPHLLNPDRIRALTHFDVALCLSVLHHHAEWADYIAALREVADLCFFETANPSEHLGHYRGYGEGAHKELSRIGTMIAQTPPMHGNHLRPMWVVGGMSGEHG